MLNWANKYGILVVFIYVVNVVQSCSYNRLLVHRRAVPRGLLPAQVPPEERARPRRDEEGARLTQNTGGRGLRRRKVCPLPKVPLGPAGKTYHVHSSPGKPMKIHFLGKGIWCIHWPENTANILANSLLMRKILG